MSAPDDVQAWYSISNMWPTRRGTYEAADLSSSSSVSLSVAQNVCYAFAYGVSSSAPQEYVVVSTGGTTSHVYSWDGTTLTSKFSGSDAAIRGGCSMARFGAATLFAIRGQIPAVKLQVASNFSSNFADSGSSAPSDKDIVIVQSNAALVFSTASNTWNASDVGDNTNWTTGESASGTFYMRPGNVSAATPYGNDAYVFMPASILRMTYVGGTVKWQVQPAWDGLGVPDRATLSVTNQPTQDWVVATQHGIVFYGGSGYIYIFDGSSAPRCLNPDTTVAVEMIRGVFTYDPVEDRLCIAPSNGSSDVGSALSEGASTVYASNYYYYSFPSDAWGISNGSSGELQTATNGTSNSSGVLRGDYSRRLNQSSRPVFWVAPDAVGTVIKRCPPISPAAGFSCYMQTQKYGRVDGKTTFNRLIPLLRRRVDLGTDSASLSFELFTEQEDTSASNTRTVTESTVRKRFDLLGGVNTDTFGRFKVTWTDLDVEVDDFVVKSTFVSDGD